MQELLSLLQEQAVVILAVFLSGKYLKTKPWFNNQFIPVVSLVLSYLGYQLAPSSAQAAGLLSPVLPHLGAGALAIFQTILITGTHSVSKNTLLPLLKLGLKAAALAALKEKN